MTGWKTFGFNILAAIMPALQMGGADLGLDGTVATVYGLVIATANLILRKFTKTAMFKKE